MGYETLEQCYDDQPMACEYFNGRCNFDEASARACVTAVSAYAGSCQPESGNASTYAFEECSEVWRDCEF